MVDTDGIDPEDLRLGESKPQERQVVMDFNHQAKMIKLSAMFGFRLPQVNVMQADQVCRQGLVQVDHRLQDRGRSLLEQTEMCTAFSRLGRGV